MRIGTWYPNNYGSTRYRCERQHHPDNEGERFFIQKYSVRGELREWDTETEAKQAAEVLNRGDVPT